MSLNPLDAYVNLELSLNSSASVEYWEARMVVNESDLNKFYIYGTGDIRMVAFVDKVFQAFLSSVISGGIIAMYVAVVLVVHRVFRAIVTSYPTEVIISEMPNVDRLLGICHDLYLVREAHDFSLEQDLYAKLVFLFRSPETLIRWTRPKQKAE